MAKGALRTFFREDAGFPEEQPDLTDFLLDSMIQNGPRMGGAPVSTSASRVSSMGGMRGYPGQQGAPGPQGPAMRRGPWGMPMPAQAPMQQQPDVTVQAPPYPGMPGPMAAPSPMPQMAKPSWIDYLSQAGGAVADGFNARAGIRSNYFGGIGAQQQGLRDREFQHAMAQRGAMENAALRAHEYEWRKYGAGQQEARFAQKADERKADVKFRDQLLAQQKAQAEWPVNLMKEVMPLRFDNAETIEDLNAMLEKSLLESQGNPAMMEAIKRAADRQRMALEAVKQGSSIWPNGYQPNMPFPGIPGQAPPPSPNTPRVFGPWVPPQYQRTR